MKLLSLFDGSGGFPLAASLCGIDPIMASEIEPYPIAVTTSRFPKMKHLGNISTINGGLIEPVDIISFGSPCQDLSVAGKRKGLKHEDNGDDETTRSGLFMEAIRIIKEMREASNERYPRFAIWENVHGAFNSNKGEDFRIVLNEFIRIKEKAAVMPDVPRGGWNHSDCYCGDGWSIAYRLFDAQYWGVPQRRRRIYLVADFGGECAREILFEQESVRRYYSACTTQGQAAATNAESRIGANDREGSELAIVDPVTFEPGILKREGGHVYEGKAGTIRANAGDNQLAVAYGTTSLKTALIEQFVFENHSPDSRYKGPLQKSPTLAARLGTGGNNVPLVVEANKKFPVYCLQGNGIDRAETAGCNGKDWREEQSYTLNTIFDPQLYQDGTCPTLVARGPAAVAAKYIVRRLTPTECARLQGFPDKWGHPDKKEDFTDEEYRFWIDVRNSHAEINGKATKEYSKAQILKWYNKLHTDSTEYKMWGNGIALPCAVYVMQGIATAIGGNEDKQWIKTNI